MRLTLLSVVCALVCLPVFAQTGNTGNLDREFGFNGMRFRENIRKYAGEVAAGEGEQANRYFVRADKYLTFEGLPISELAVETHGGRIAQFRCRVSKADGPAFLQALVRRYGAPFMILTDDEYGAFDEHMQLVEAADYYWSGRRVALLYLHQAGDDRENVYIQLSETADFMRAADPDAE